MRFTAWFRSPAIRARLLVAAVLAGCFVWAMVVVGLSFAMVESGGRQWWVIPLFGAFVLAMAVLAVRRIPTARSPVDAGSHPPVGRHGRLAEPLSPREVEVLRLLAAGHPNSEIARTLFVAPGTVKAHLNHIFRKLEAANRVQAVARGREAGLLE